MSIEKKLLRYKNEMEEIDKDVQRGKGSLDQLYESLEKDLDIKGKPDKIEKETKKMIKKIEKQGNDNTEKLETLMEEIDTEYKKFEGEEE